MKSALTNKVLASPIYNSGSSISITSLSKVYQGSTVVYHDEEIGHLQTREIEDIQTYYDEQYKFFDQSDEEDIIYMMVDGKKVYRQQHQVDTLIDKISFDSPKFVLDYGCAKGTVMKRLAEQKDSVTPFLFDVSDMYSHLWDQFVPKDHYASYKVKDEWTGKFDLITSFFAFEHVSNPLLELRNIKQLLRKDGLVYLIVPNVFANTGDFIVADHVHHFSEASLSFLFAQVGIEVLEIDSTSHFAAFIVVGKNTAERELPFHYPVKSLDEINTQIRKIAEFWEQVRDRIRDFEVRNRGKESAIYGAGVYGNFIFSCLENEQHCFGFLDQNSLLIGSQTMEKPIVHPDELPPSIEVLYVGLNPVISRDVIAGIESWKNRELAIMYI